MDKYHQDHQPNTDKSRESSLDDILAEFNLNKLGMHESEPKSSHVPMEFGVPKFAFDEEDHDMKLYTPAEVEKPAREIVYMDEDYTLPDADEAPEDLSFGQEKFQSESAEDDSWEDFDFDFDLASLRNNKFQPDEEAFRVPEFSTAAMEPEQAHEPEDDSAADADYSDEDSYLDDSYLEDEYIEKKSRRSTKAGKGGLFSFFKKLSKPVDIIEDEEDFLPDEISEEEDEFFTVEAPEEEEADEVLPEAEEIWDELDFDFDALREEVSQPAEAEAVVQPESLELPDYEPEQSYEFHGGYDPEEVYDDEDEYIDQPTRRSSQSGKPGFFGIFKKRSSGSIGAMEDEARNIAAKLQAEEHKAEAEAQAEEDFDLYRHLDELAFLNELEAEKDAGQADAPEVQALEEEYADEYSEDDYSDAEYTEEDFRNEFSDLPDFDGDEAHYYEAREHYHHESGNYEYALDMGYDADPTSYSREDHRNVYAPVVDDDIEIDSRFNLSGRKKRSGMVYGSTAVDLSADEDYTPTQQLGYSPTQWTADYDDPLAEKVEEAPQRKKHKFIIGKKKKQAVQKEEYDPYGGTAPADGEVLEDFDDLDAGPSDYAAKGEYGEGKRYEEEDMYFPPTFREYVLSIFASMFLRVRGSVRGDTVGTMDDTEEDLGAELSPAAASKYYGSFVKSLKLRLRISAVLLVILCYVSLELPVPGMLKTLPVAAAFCFALQSAIMLLALDVVTTGVLNAFRLKIGADSLAVVACIFTGIDAAIVALSDTAALHMPLCAISSFSIVGLLCAAFLNARGMRKALRVPAIGKRFYAVTGELKLKAQELTLLKSLRSYNGFVRRSEEAAPDETAFVKLGPPVLLLALLLSIITAAVKKSFPDFIFIYSAIIAAAVPFTALLSFTLPFFLGSTRIFKSGSAIAGWSGLCDIGSSRNIIITDRDLFPESAITMESVRIFADEDAQKVISYAGSMMQASGACSAASFMELMEENDCEMKPVSGFEFLPGGGVKGVIEGHKVLCGSTELMRLMNVRIPFRLTDKTTVLLAIDGILYGIFSLHYEPLPQVRRALVELVRSSRHPVFAVRDFNINPEMLHNTFDIATDGYDFPPYADRLDLSTPTEDKNTRSIAAVICNEGLGPLTTVADVGRRMYVSARTNVLINVIASVFGMFFVFFKFITVGSLSLGALLVFMLFASLPVFAVSLYVNIKS